MNNLLLKKLLPRLSRSALSTALGLCFLCAISPAQDLASRSADILPDAPAVSDAVSGGSSSSSPIAPAPEGTQADGAASAPPKRLFGIVPNFRSVSTTTTLPRQTVREKFSDATQDSFDYSSLFLAVAVASYSYGSNNTPEFGTGGVGYGRYLWHSAADQTVENYLVEFIVPVIAHEDTRFYTLGRGGFARRAEYSLGRILITKSDSGKQVFNAGEIVGAAASSGISNFYYPRPERTFGNFGRQYGTNLGIDAASYFVKEFYPEISRGFRHKKGPDSAP